MFLLIKNICQKVCNKLFYSITYFYIYNAINFNYLIQITLLPLECVLGKTKPS